MDIDSAALDPALDAVDSTFSGVLTVDAGGRRLYARAAGLADRGHRVPNALDTRFQTASGCKVFTAAAALRLVQDGRLSLDDRLADRVDAEFPRFDPGVTLRHLLTHTAGIPDYWDEDGGQDYADLWRERPMYRMESPRDFLPLFAAAPMRFAPGERFRYTDAGFVLLGLIVEAAGGLPFARFVQEAVLAPAGMADTGYFRLDRLPERCAQAYVAEEDGAWRTNIYAVPVAGGPDGGAWTTAADMARFWDALRGGRILDAEHAALLLAPQVETPEEKRSTHYGLGVWLRVADGEPVCHFVSGWDPGVAFLSAHHPGDGVVITVLRNGNGPLWALHDAAAAALGLP